MAEHRLRREPPAGRRLRRVAPAARWRAPPPACRRRAARRPAPELVDAVAEHGLHQVLARREVPVERADADARAAGDLLHRRVGTPGREHLAAPLSTMRARLRSASARGPRRGLLGGVDLDGVHAHGAVLPPDPPTRSGLGKALATGGPLRLVSGGAVRLCQCTPRPHPPRSDPQERPMSTESPALGPPVPALAAGTTTEYANRGWILAVMCLALVMVVAGVSMLANALPSIAADLDASQSSQQWIVDAYALALAALLLPAGAIGDRFGRRGALIAGTAIFGVGVGCCRRSPSSAGPLIGAARAHGHRRRAPHARHAVDHHQRVPARGAGQGGRHLGRLRRRRRHARHPGVGRAARAVLRGARSSSSPPGSRPLSCIGVIARRAEHASRGARRARPARRGAVGRRHRPARARHHRRPRTRAGPTRSRWSA